MISHFFTVPIVLGLLNLALLATFGIAWLSWDFNYLLLYSALAHFNTILVPVKCMRRQSHSQI